MNARETVYSFCFFYTSAWACSNCIGAGLKNSLAQDVEQGAHGDLSVVRSRLSEQVVELLRRAVARDYLQEAEHDPGIQLVRGIFLQLLQRLLPLRAVLLLHRRLQCLQLLHQLHELGLCQPLRRRLRALEPADLEA